MTDDELRTIGRAILLGDQRPTAATPEQLRRGVELAAEDLSRVLAPYGFTVRSLADESPAERDRRELREFVILGILAIGIVIVLFVIVLVAIALMPHSVPSP